MAKHRKELSDDIKKAIISLIESVHQASSVAKSVGMLIHNFQAFEALAGAWSKLHWTVNNQWKKVIFTDEMMMVIKPDGTLKVRRKSNEIWRPECPRYVAQRPSTNLKIMVWGCITYYGVGTLAMINGNMNSVKYIETLDDNLWQVVTKHFSKTRYHNLPGLHNHQT
ncbi:Hypothetical predicted protein [Mytilus galloprovincialis]|uniref:Uncharacterized protein n=1 Tax=Mytilus galloprovincialis TaxID=29158 RepID=A0A8B6CP79_MYTGA|nr:Hypothetical predicted protein [Mytilus galloprovincialis]